MNEFEHDQLRKDFLLRYVQAAPLQLSLIRFEEAYAMGQLPMQKPILDIGCSDGIFGNVLMRGVQGSIDVGIDVDHIYLKEARKRKVYKKVVFADARKLPFPANSFQTVISNQSMEHISQVELVLKEVARVLKPGGQFIFLVPTVYLDQYWLTSVIPNAIGLKFLGSWLHDMRNRIFEHHNLWKVEEWKKKLEDGQPASTRVRSSTRGGLRVTSFQYLRSRRNYFISELLWPVRLPQYVLTRLFKRPVLIPRWIELSLARLIFPFLDQPQGDGKKGPTVMIRAQKQEIKRAKDQENKRT